MSTKTKAIICPKGDTGMFTVSLTGATFDNTAVSIFAVCNRSGVTLFHKAIPIVDGTITVRLTNSETNTIPIGEHFWDIRIVTDPAYDADNNVIADEDTDEVHSVFAGTGMPKFSVKSVAVNV